MRDDKKMFVKKNFPPPGEVPSATPAVGAAGVLRPD